MEKRISAHKGVKEWNIYKYNEENKIVFKAFETVAWVSSISTIKYIANTSADEKSTLLKYGLIGSTVMLQNLEYLANTIQEIEHKIKANEDERELLEAENREIKKALKTYGNDYEKCLELEWNYNTNSYLIDSLTAQNETHRDELRPLYKKLENCLTDGYDLKHIAFLGIWEYHKQVVERLNSLDLTSIDTLNDTDKIQALVNIILAMEFRTETVKVIQTHNVKKIKKEYKVIGKSKNGQLTKVKVFETLTVKKIGDKAVRAFLNGNRSGVGAKTDYIIVGEDENGNELLIQNSKLETLGGIDTAESKILYNEILARAEKVLTARQVSILKYMIAGYNQTEIAEKLNVKQNTICDHIKKIKNNLESVGVNNLLKKAN